ncbi:Fic family protein [Tenuibacillus multivorans]|uniref:Fic family protein n=1 Tax=Tenuibacillus multivorans TaxID=237069 RepID=A0A1G9X5Z5_9BACI|nr:Fic family protein [Tenuibacillus multivorans]GEL78650.1 cell division protein Fic [Tenuibacillus multivorans]SDM92149.1 Fic family protein [Tenuibacillus multivorans]
MRRFEYSLLKHLRLPMETVNLISKINEYKGKQDLYIQQAPQILKSLKDVAVIQSTKASNAIEGIFITDKRLKGLMKLKTIPSDRSEGEIAGYRDVLNLVHASHQAIPVNTNVILQLHKELHNYIPAEGGKWKHADNVITEKLPNGQKVIRFQPVSAYETPDAMDSLCNELNERVSKEDVEPLILISVFILDFLSVHPFNDGNGRMARILTLLLLYKHQFEVGRYISLEKVIEDTKEGYYETLRQSSQGWHEGKNDIFPWVNYILSTIVAAYKELESRVGFVQTGKGNKAARIKKYIENKIGFFTKEDIRKACPDVSESTINRVLNELKDKGVVEPTGLGRGAKWKKIQ